MMMQLEDPSIIIDLRANNGFKVNETASSSLTTTMLKSTERSLIVSGMKWKHILMR